VRARGRFLVDLLARPRAALVPVALAVLCAACGGGSKHSSPAPTGSSGTAAVPRGSGPLTEAECMRLLDHYLELAMAERRATLPAEEVPTEEQVARIRVDMRENAKETCIGRTERVRYECAMMATTTRSLATCLTDKAEGG
jgi:hypothetical protein